MSKYLTVVAVLVLAACGGEKAPEPPAAEPAAAAAPVDSTAMPMDTTASDTMAADTTHH